MTMSCSAVTGAVRRLEPELAALVIEAGQSMIEPEVDARASPPAASTSWRLSPARDTELMARWPSALYDWNAVPAGRVVQDPAAHREGLGEDGVRESGALEGVDAADRQGEVDRPTGLEIGSPRVRAALVERDLVSAPGKEDREERPGESGTDDRDPGVWHRLDRSASGGTMAG